MRRNRPDTSILFDEIYIVGILMLTWFLFRLCVIFFLVQFWNVCVPSALIDFRADYVGIFWFLAATDVFVLFWLVAYAYRAWRSRALRWGRALFILAVAAHVVGNLAILPMLYEWRVIQQDPRASYDFMWAEQVASWPADKKPPGRIVTDQWRPCVPPGEVRFMHDVWAEEFDIRDVFWRAYAMRTSGGMNEALGYTEYLASLDGGGEAWAMKALVYGNAVDYMGLPPALARPSAEGALERALMLAPDALLTHAAYGLVHQRSDPQGAESRLCYCVSQEPGFPECHNLYGDLLRKTGRAEQAGEIYVAALERWPENGELHVSYALYLQEAARPQQAIEYLRELVADQPDFPRAHWHLAVMLYEEGGDLDEMREHAVKALEMDPKIWNREKLLLELLWLQAQKGH